MARETRLDHIYSGLTALERARLVLKTWHDGTREDPGWRLTMPRRQGNQFNEHIYTMNAANMHVANMINMLDGDLQLLWERLLRLTMLAKWAIDLEDAPSAPRGAQRRAKPGEGVPVADRLAELDAAMDALLESLTDGAGLLWTSMRAVEVGLEEMTATFDGTDPLKPTHRRRLQDVRMNLIEVIEWLESFDVVVERREPDEELLRFIRGSVHAMRVMMA